RHTRSKRDWSSDVCSSDLAESWGSALQYFTGSQAHNIATRKIAIAQGLKLSEWGVFRGTKQIAGKTEEEVYKAIGLPFIAPELRSEERRVGKECRSQRGT